MQHTHTASGIVDNQPPGRDASQHMHALVFLVVNVMCVEEVMRVGVPRRIYT